MGILGRKIGSRSAQARAQMEMMQGKNGGRGVQKYALPKVVCERCGDKMVKVVGGVRLCGYCVPVEEVG